MFYCKNCGYEFEKPEKHYETHNLTSSPFETVLTCPACKSVDFFEKHLTHCKLCGIKLSEGLKDYCSDECRKREISLKAKKSVKTDKNSSLKEILNTLDNYNSLNNKNLSYGQFVAYVLPKEKKKCKKRKNT